MKIFVKSEILATNIKNKIEKIETIIKEKTDESVKNMTNLMNEERLKIGWLDRIFNFIGFSKVKKEPVTEDEIKEFIDRNEIYCNKLYASLNIRTYWKSDCFMLYTNSPAYQHMFHSNYLSKLKRLNILHKMAILNNQLFCEITEDEYQLIYE